MAKDSISPNNRGIQFRDKLCVGALAGMIGCTVAYPIDTVKTRLQHQRLVTGALNVPEIAGGIVRREGIRGLYRGLPQTLIGVTPERAIELAVNDACREYFFNEYGRLYLWQEMLSGGAAGAAQCIVTNPMEIIKIRLQLQGTQPLHERKTAYRVIQELAGTSLSQGFYKGSLTTLARDIPFCVVLFPMYNYMKEALFHASHSSARKDRAETAAESGQMLLAGFLSGAVAAGATTPIDVVKTRLQAQGNTERSALLVLGKIVSGQGPRALFKGMLPRMITVGFLFSVSLFAYDMQKWYLLPDKMRLD